MSYGFGKGENDGKCQRAFALIPRFKAMKLISYLMILDGATGGKMLQGVCKLLGLCLLSDDHIEIHSKSFKQKHIFIFHRYSY